LAELAHISFRERIERAEQARHSGLATPSYPARRVREEPDSVAFCHGLGLDYVSCSPYRVPVARLAAAQAALAEAGVEAVTAGG